MTGLPSSAGARLLRRDRSATGLGEATKAALGQPTVAAPAPNAFARLVLFDSVAASAGPWLRLQALAAASPYQTLAWVGAWADTEGLASGTRPLICVAADEAGRPLALLPFGLVRRGPVTSACFLGGRHSNYNLGLFDPAVAWSLADVTRLLGAIAAAAPARIDLFALTNQPHGWGAWANPLALLPRQASPSQGHSTLLRADGEAFLREHQSAAARKKLRSKATQLAALGPVGHLVARSAAEVDAILDAYVAQKAAKLASTGAASRADLAGIRDLLGRAATRGTNGSPVLDLHALTCGGRIVATFGGLSHAGRCSGLVISHDADPTFARLSPGELLLAEVIRAQCEAGFASFDLGIGEDRYKQSLCPVVDPLFDSLIPASLKGRLFVAQEALRLRLKGRIKQSPRAWAAAKRLRKLLAGMPLPR